MITIFVICFFIGIIAGTMSGLFGIGGGIIFVPAIMFCLDLLHVDKTIFMQLALGTSLSCIVMTTSNSFYAQVKRSNVDWITLKKMSIGVAIGVIGGSLIAAHLPSKLLEIFFALFLLFVTAKMWLNFKVSTQEKKIATFWYWFIGIIIGLKSSILGIGGGTISVPFLTWTGKPMKTAVGVSAGLGVIISTIATMTYIYTGYHQIALPKFSLGFIYLPALIAMAPTSIIFAHFGAKLADRMDQKKLYLLFSIFLLVVLTKTVYRILF